MEDKDSLGIVVADGYRKMAYRKERVAQILEDDERPVLRDMVLQIG